MALIKCPECGKEISDAANECPNCGKPLSVDDKAKGFQIMEEQKKKENSFFHVDIAGAAAIFAVIIPIVGFILAIVAIAKGKVRNGIAALILSILFSGAYYIIINYLMSANR